MANKQDSIKSKFTEETQTIHSAGDCTLPPDLRILHYNDVYHVDASSAEPVGGIARFQTVVDQYRHGQEFKGQPELLTFFSGDAFNPSLESSVTKGSHMVPILNNIGTNVACVGNHDLDFGIRQFRYLSQQCHFPWLLANVLDPALGENVPLGNANPTTMLESSNGIKIGVIGLVEREWLDTINSLPPNLVYKSAYKTAEELVPGLREQGAELIVVVAHQREPNDNKVAKMVRPGLVDLILGGHDHHYAHSVINGCHVLRSGTDFKQLSYIEARRSREQNGKWDFNIARRDIVSSIKEDPGAKEVAAELTDALKAKLDKPIGATIAPLDARFLTVRRTESNMGNFICDLMRTEYGGDCTIMAAGTIRGDQIYPPGLIRLRDIMNCFPFEDPCVVILAPGQAILDALENGVSTYPALEGRFPQVSNITFTFDPSLPPGKRIPNPTKNITIAGQSLDLQKKYKLVTRDYMARGKDGFDSLLVKSEGGELEEIVSEENGMLLSMLLRQYFMSLKTLGRWSKWGKSMDRHWQGVHKQLHLVQPVVEAVPRTPSTAGPGPMDGTAETPASPVQARRGLKRAPTVKDTKAGKYLDDSDDEEHTMVPDQDVEEVRDQERRMRIMRQVVNKWVRIAGVSQPRSCDNLREGEFDVEWTRAISPRVEGRIRVIGVNA
ncbi:hypothetical protein LTR70_003331 [Exophiala xenobiotica]|uniref:5'-nucleotidase n=1 Tax=Lithohypha guttulata TaxID=1690604 RepID=A0ABR0KLQ3_9EURO|nr:hypothetical protein LTR24_001204 [Lithohypha guttulata]KAK5323653.1 hypothetical protein LTR70_003331 [Exophiala xenobiotica]